MRLTTPAPTTPVLPVRVGDRRVIAVEVDSRAVYAGDYREPIVDAGTAHLDRLTWVARRHLLELVAELHPSRHTWVATVIRNLIGNLEAPQERTP